MQRLPELGPHQDQGEVLDLAGLDQRRALEDLVHGAEAAGEDHEGVGVLDQHHLADEEVAELEPAVDVRVRLLLGGEDDVAADRRRADVAGAAVGGLHDPRAAAGHHREAGAAEPPADLAGEGVVAVVLLEAGGAEDGDAGAHEVEAAEAADEVGADAQQPAQLGEAAVGAGEEMAVLGMLGPLPPPRRLAALGRRLLLHLGGGTRGFFGSDLFHARESSKGRAWGADPDGSEARAGAAPPGPHSPGPSLPASLPPRRERGENCLVSKPAGRRRSQEGKPVIAGPPSSPGGRGGGGEKRAGVMRAGGEAPPSCS